MRAEHAGDLVVDLRPAAARPPPRLLVTGVGFIARQLIGQTKPDVALLAFETPAKTATLGRPVLLRRPVELQVSGSLAKGSEVEVVDTHTAASLTCPDRGLLSAAGQPAPTRR